MNWDAIGAIAEMLGAIAVLITLVYLAFQLKQANTNIQATVAQSQADNQLRWMADLAKDSELYRIYRAGLLDDSALTREERGRFDLIVCQVIVGVDAHQQKQEMGAIRKEQLETIANSVMPVLNTPGGRASYERQRSVITREFQQTLDEMLASKG